MRVRDTPIIDNLGVSVYTSGLPDRPRPSLGAELSEGRVADKRPALPWSTDE